ncbi:histidine phosphatase family protein [Sediminicoccus sp. BL-A-41-H5]|jgi:phosphohistidine phosphatase SixA|uniref:histidine phosphatase family protein n=1 Tax=Sediminicoccus sp. BL-A-41-H5 TaxID=3421106 RepID=UPI003D66B765
MIRRLTLFALIFLGMDMPAARAEPGLLAALREGGLVIFLRHTETGSTAPDNLTAVMGDCATQRNLDETGRAQAVAIGTAFRELGIPVSRVLSSPFCRTLETAALAFGGAETENALSLPRHLDEAAHREMGEALRGLLPEPGFGGNWVLVGHSYHMMRAGGPAPQPQGAAVVMRPEGQGRFTVLAILPPDGWTRLARQRFAEAR